jgi:drug/metabolite transporter (DMT)-like permease
MAQEMTATIGIYAALGSAASWALGSVLFKPFGKSLSSLAMVLAKEFLSVLLLLVPMLLLGWQQLGWEPLGLLILSGLLGIALGDAFFFAALRHLSPLALVLLSTLGQALTVVLAMALRIDALTPTMICSLALVTGGVAIVLYEKISTNEGASSPRGIVYGTISVVCMSIATLVAKQAFVTASLADDAALGLTLQATFIRTLAGAMGVFGLGLAMGRLPAWVMPFQNRRLALVFFVAVLVVTYGGFWLSLVAVKNLKVSVANTLNATEPLFTAVLAAALLKERLNWKITLGTIMSVSGIVWLFGT